MTNTKPYDALVNFFDSYNRTARIYPSLIALMPILWSAILLFPQLITSLGSSTMFVFAAACILYFLASLARSSGKKAEITLLKFWGGWPTTILLRHSDTTLDSVTKERYHRALEVLSGLTLPTAAEEAQDPTRADDFYRSATKKLIELRRDPQYSLLHSENASYGFRRNLYGLKLPVLVELVILIALTAFGWWLITPQPYDRLVLAESVLTYPQLPILLILNFSYLLVWINLVTPSFVFESGREYGEALLRSLDA